MLSLAWTRLLLQAMGDRLNGLYLTFQSVVQLGTIGDLGLSGAVCARTAQFLAKDQNEEGKEFLADARGVFFGLAAILGLFLALLAPVLGPWLGFSTDSTSFTVQALFWMGGLALTLGLIGGYFNSLNYAHGNVVWPIIPAFLVTQINFLSQWLLARSGADLWQIYGAGVVCTALGVIVVIRMLRASHPWLGNLRPLRFNLRAFGDLSSSAFWFSLCALSNLIYVTTDRLLISAGFGPEFVPAYRNNFKLCELAIMLINTASLVALPAILRRLLSATSERQLLGQDGLLRLQRIQVLAAVAFGVTYLCFNDLFIRWWLGAAYTIPLSWQTAFALNAAFTISGETSIQVLPRFEGSALRRAGLICAGAGLLNLGLSYVSMRSGSILGIACATIVAQTFASIYMAVFVCRRTGLAFSRWLARTWLLPGAVILLASVIRSQFGPDGWTSALLLGGMCLALTVCAAFLLRLSWKTLVDELGRMRTPVRE